MRVLVCGSRTWTDQERIEDELRTLHHKAGVISVIHGGAYGADLLATAAVLELQDDGQGVILEKVFPADWRRHGKAAGPIRNRRMLKEGRPDLVLAFWDGRSRGTKHMIDIARAAGVPVEIITAEDAP